MKALQIVALVALAGIVFAVLARLDWGGAGSGAKSPHRPPNILLIMADDLGNNDIGLLGDGSAQTPNIDELARAGARFRRHYANPTCRPSRMALLTGMSSSRVGVPPHIRGITPELVTLPEALGASGYATVHIGKWHLGHHHESAHPDRQGFDDWYGFLTVLLTKHGNLQRPGRTYLNPWLQRRGGSPERQQGHMTDLLTDAAVENISRLSATGQPWFINLWYLAPHEPIQPASLYASKFANTPEGRYLALVAQLDDSVGRLMAALEDAGARDDTLVVFLSDNGGTNHHRNSNKPYFGRKNTFREGGMRTPLILNWPGRIEPAAINEPVFISEVMPTLLGVAGVAIPASVSGRSLAPLLTGGTVAREPAYLWDVHAYSYGKYAVLDLVQDLLVDAQVRQLWDTSSGQFGPPAPGEPALIAQMGERYRQWAQQTRLVDLLPRRLPDGTTQYRGDSYRRTPGFGGWTLQVPVFIAAGSSASVSQQGRFQVEVSGDLVRVKLPGHGFSVPLPASGCQLLSLSAYYMWMDRPTKPSHGHVSLHLGQDLVFQQDFPIELDLLGDSYEPTVASAGAGPLVISNDYLQAELVPHYERAAGETFACSNPVASGPG